MPEAVQRNASPVEPEAERPTTTAPSDETSYASANGNVPSLGRKPSTAVPPPGVHRHARNCPPVVCAEPTTAAPALATPKPLAWKVPAGRGSVTTPAAFVQTKAS